MPKNAPRRMSGPLPAFGSGRTQRTEHGRVLERYKTRNEQVNRVRTAARELEGWHPVPVTLPLPSALRRQFLLARPDEIHALAWSRGLD